MQPEIPHQPLAQQAWFVELLDGKGFCRSSPDTFTNGKASIRVEGTNFSADAGMADRIWTADFKDSDPSTIRMMIEHILRLQPFLTEAERARIEETERRSERVLPSLPPGNAHTRRPHILYLDDEWQLVLLARRALERFGYRVSGFTQPSEALTAFKNDPSQYDLVVTDFNMPSMSGLEMVRHLLSLRPGLPVLLTSGYLSEELEANARAAGVSGLIYKPNTVQEMSKAVQRFLGEIKQP